MEKAKSLDLNLFDARPGAEEGRWLTLKDPETGDDTPARLLLKGGDSQAWKDKELEQRRARLEIMERSGTSRVDPAYADREVTDRLVAVTAKWEGIARDGVDWPCTPQNIVEFYNGWPQFRAQAVIFIGTRANFYPRSASAS